MRQLWGLRIYLRPYWKAVVLALVVMAAAGGLSALALFKTRDVFEPIFGRLEGLPPDAAREQMRVLLRAAVILFAALVAAAAADGASIYFGEYVGQHLLLELRRRLFNHLQTLSMSFYDARRSGELISRINNDTSILHQALGANLAWLIVCPVGALGMTAAMIAISWRLTLGLAVVIPVVALVTLKLGGTIRALSRHVQERLQELTTVLHESIAAARVVKIFGLQPQAIERFDRENTAVMGAEMDAALTRGLNSPIVGIVVAASIVGILLVGAQEITLGRMTAAGLMTFVILLQGLASQVNRATRLNLALQRAAAAAIRTQELLEHDERLPVVENPFRPQRIEGRVTFEDVSFAYRGRAAAVEHIDLDIAPGEVVALAGPSGAGKTTLANLVPRLYDPDRGRILIDGTDVREMDPQVLRSHMSLVPQETLLFATTISENIGYGRAGATQEEIIQAATAGNAHDFIMRLPEGYDTQVGERGAQLSGGQRQRIAIARAVLRDPAVLILDEATSALDRESERAVHKALLELLTGRTAIIIAHRLSTIRSADRIVVLDHGRIVETGTHDQLMARGGLYARLYEARELQPPVDVEPTSGL